MLLPRPWQATTLTTVRCTLIKVNGWTVGLGIKLYAFANRTKGSLSAVSLVMKTIHTLSKIKSNLY